MTFVKNINFCLHSCLQRLCLKACLSLNSSFLFTSFISLIIFHYLTSKIQHSIYFKTLIFSFFQEKSSSISLYAVGFSFRVPLTIILHSMSDSSSEIINRMSFNASSFIISMNWMQAPLSLFCPALISWCVNPAKPTAHGEDCRPALRAVHGPWPCRPRPQ